MDDKKIILNILLGNINEFKIIVEKYEKLVFHIINRLISSKNDKEELYQEIFIKVFKNLESFRFQSKLSTWIGKIAYNTTLNFLGKRNSSIIDVVENEDMNLSMQKSDFKSPESFAEEKNLALIVKEHINNLPDKYKMIISLYHMEDFSYSEISEIMNMPEGTVKNYLFRARKLLKEKMSLNYSLEDL
ncbi:MAG: sigma-70 family RNA polymerase sigma factor [Calditrichia bacterium]|nr:sigma-70 family RNA polymerase sigma factor [Calditrichia bacterium]